MRSVRRRILSALAATLVATAGTAGPVIDLASSTVPTATLTSAPTSDSSIAVGHLGGDPALLDLVVGDHRNIATRIYFDAVSGALDASADADVTITATYANPVEFGGSVAVGDFTGDGQDDVAIADPIGWDTAVTQGVVELYEGPFTAGSLTSSNRLVRIFHLYQDAYLGQQQGLAVADVDADGTEDVIIGAPWAHRLYPQPLSWEYDPWYTAGRVYVLDGRSPTAWLALGTGARIGLDETVADVTYVAANGNPGGPAESGDHLGRFVGAGDVDGDGDDDVVFSTVNRQLNPQGFRSTIYVDHAVDAASYPAHHVVDLRSASTSRQVGSAASGVGVDVAVGDIVGSSAPDLVIGASSPSEGVASALVVAGPFTAGILDIDVTPPCVTITPSSPSGGLGRNVEIGDVTGDGSADVVVGEPLADPSSRTDAGRAWIACGPLACGTLDLATDLLTRFDGAAAGDHLGQALLVARWNPTSDTTADLFLGSTEADATNADEGRLDLVLGGSDLECVCDPDKTMSCPLTVIRGCSDGTPVALGAPCAVVTSDCSWTLTYEVTGATTVGETPAGPDGCVVTPFSVGDSTVTFTAHHEDGSETTCTSLVTVQPTPTACVTPSTTDAMHWNECGTETRLLDGSCSTQGQPGGPMEYIWLLGPGCPAGTTVVPVTGSPHLAIVTLGCASDPECNLPGSCEVTLVVKEETVDSDPYHFCVDDAPVTIPIEPVPPVMGCPELIQCCYPVLQTSIAAFAIDDCSGVTTSFTADGSPASGPGLYFGGVFQGYGRHEVVFTATDSGGNSSQCTTFVDLHAPPAACFSMSDDPDGDFRRCTSLGPNVVLSAACTDPDAEEPGWDPEDPPLPDPLAYSWHLVPGSCAATLTVGMDPSEATLEYDELAIACGADLTCEVVLTVKECLDHVDPSCVSTAANCLESGCVEPPPGERPEGCCSTFTHEVTLVPPPRVDQLKVPDCRETDGCIRVGVVATDCSPPSDLSYAWGLPAAGDDPCAPISLTADTDPSFAIVCLELDAEACNVQVTITDEDGCSTVQLVPVGADARPIASIESGPVGSPTSHLCRPPAGLELRSAVTPPCDDAVFTWTADCGAIVGSGASVEWVPPPDTTPPPDESGSCDVTLVVSCGDCDSEEGRAHLSWCDSPYFALPDVFVCEDPGSTLTTLVTVTAGTSPPEGRSCDPEITYDWTVHAPCTLVSQDDPTSSIVVSYDDTTDVNECVVELTITSGGCSMGPKTATVHVYDAPVVDVPASIAACIDPDEATEVLVVATLVESEAGGCTYLWELVGSCEGLDLLNETGLTPTLLVEAAAACGDCQLRLTTTCGPCSVETLVDVDCCAAGFTHEALSAPVLLSAPGWTGCGSILDLVAWETGCVASSHVWTFDPPLLGLTGPVSSYSGPNPPPMVARSGCQYVGLVTTVPCGEIVSQCRYTIPGCTSVEYEQRGVTTTTFPFSYGTSTRCRNGTNPCTPGDITVRVRMPDVDACCAAPGLTAGPLTVTLSKAGFPSRVLTIASPAVSLVGGDAIVSGVLDDKCVHEALVALGVACNATSGVTATAHVEVEIDCPPDPPSPIEPPPFCPTTWTVQRQASAVISCPTTNDNCMATNCDPTNACP